MKSNKYCLCLDVSLKCTGYSIFNIDTNELVEMGIIDTSKMKIQDKEHHGEKLLFIFNSLNKLEKKYEFDLIIEERSFIKHPTATKILQKVLGVIELLFNKKEIILISPQSTKCYLCKKDAEKEDMIKAVNFAYDLNLSIKKDGDADISDSIALWLYYVNNKNKVEEAKKPKKKTVKKTDKKTTKII